MDEFVKQAFADAENSIIDKESKAFMRMIGNDEGDIAHKAAAIQVGLDKMDELCKVVLIGGVGDTLAEYAYQLMIIGFHIGYRAGMEDKE